METIALFQTVKKRSYQLILTTKNLVSPSVWDSKTRIERQSQQNMLMWFLPLFLTLLNACTPTQELSPVEAQTLAQAAWQQPWQGSWELSWPESPVAGPIIFAAWQNEAGQQRRYEILEAGVPSLVGLVYINDGQTATIFNRFAADRPRFVGDVALPFSPLSHAFDQVSMTLTRPPLSAQQTVIALPNRAGRQLTLTYSATEALTLWLDPTTNLIWQAAFESPDIRFTLIARTLEPLPQPHPQLFSTQP